MRFVTLGTSTSFMRRAWSFTSSREIKSRAPVSGSVRTMQITKIDESKVRTYMFDQPPLPVRNRNKEYRNKDREEEVITPDQRNPNLRAHTAYLMRQCWGTVDPRY